MEKVYKFFKYKYYSYSQGTKDSNYEYALLRVDSGNSFQTNVRLLMTKKYKSFTHEIDENSIEDLTITDNETNF